MSHLDRGVGKGSFGIFKFLVSLILILLDLLCFVPNLDVFVDLLLNKRVHETLKYNSPQKILV